VKILKIFSRTSRPISTSWHKSSLYMHKDDSEIVQIKDNPLLEGEKMAK
jgi:hypothetical protein